MNHKATPHKSETSAESPKHVEELVSETNKKYEIVSSSHLHRRQIGGEYESRSSPACKNVSVAPEKRHKHISDKVNMLSKIDRDVPSNKAYIASPPSMSRKKKKFGKCNEISAAINTFISDDSSLAGHSLSSDGSKPMKKHKKHHRHTADLLANPHVASDSITNRHAASYNRSVFADGANKNQSSGKCNDAGQNSSMVTLDELSECGDITLCNDFTNENVTHLRKHKRKREIGKPIKRRKTDLLHDQASVTANGKSFPSYEEITSDISHSLPLMVHVKRDKNKKIISDTTLYEQTLPVMNVDNILKDDSHSASSSKKHRKRKESRSINAHRQTSLLTDFFSNVSDNTSSLPTIASDGNQLTIDDDKNDSLQSNEIICGTDSITDSKNKIKHRKRESSGGAVSTCTQSDHKKFTSLQSDRIAGDPSHGTQSGSTDVNRGSNTACIEDTIGSTSVLRHKHHHKKARKLHADELGGNDPSCEKSSEMGSEEINSSKHANTNDTSSFLPLKIHRKSKKKKRNKLEDAKHKILVTDDSGFDDKDVHVDVGSGQNANVSGASSFLIPKSHKKTKKEENIKLKNSEHNDFEIDSNYEYQRDGEYVQIEDVRTTVCSVTEPKLVFDEKCSDVMLQRLTKTKDRPTKVKSYSKKLFGKCSSVEEDGSVFCTDARISKRSLRRRNENERSISSETRTIGCQNQKDVAGTMPTEACSDEDTTASDLDLYIPDNETSGSEYCGSSQTPHDESDDRPAKPSSSRKKNATRRRVNRDSMTRSDSTTATCQKERLAEASSSGRLPKTMTLKRTSTDSNENTGSHHPIYFVSEERCAVIHNENIHSGRLRGPDLERLKGLNIHVTEGIWAKEEDERLLHNLTTFWNKYSKCAGAVTLDGLVHPEKDPDTKEEIRNFIKEYNFYIAVAKTLNRTTYACYRRAKLIYNRKNFNQKWSQSDSKKLIELCNKYDEDWPRIAAELDRTETAVKTRFTHIKGGEITPGRKKWTEEESERLRNAIREVMGIDDLTNLVKEMPWGKIATHMPGRTATRLREKWLFCLKWREDHKEDEDKREKWSPLNDCCLLRTIRQQNVQDERDVDWDIILKYFDNCPSTAFLELKWQRLKNKVQNHRWKSLAEICDALEAVVPAKTEIVNDIPLECTSLQTVEQNLEDQRHITANPPIKCENLC